MTTFTPLFAVPTVPAAATVPLAGKASRLLSVYDGTPADDQPWQAAAIAAAHQLGAKAEATLKLTLEPLGMPYGPDMSHSRRVARVLGLVTDTGTTTPEWGLAQGSVQAFWHAMTEGEPSLVVEFSAPEVLAVVGALDSFSQEFLRTRCLRQYQEQALSLLDHVALPAFAVSLHVVFTGEWEPQTELIRRSLELVVREHFSEFQDLPALRAA